MVRVPDRPTGRPYAPAVPAEVVIVIPVLDRPHRIGPLMANVAAATPEPYRLLFMATGNDHDELAALEAAGADHIVIPGARRNGDYSVKTNLGARESDEPLIFTGADDLVFHPGWLAAAKRRLGTAQEWVTEPFNPDALIGVVGTNDLGNPDVLRGLHATHSIVTRAYMDDFGVVDEPGAIYHSGYDHNYCDVEMVETAKVRDAFVHAADSIVEHLHPSWHKAERDPIYELGIQNWREDNRLWRRRRRKIRQHAHQLYTFAGLEPPAEPAEPDPALEPPT